VKHYWSKKADKDLDRIYRYVCDHFTKEIAINVYYKIKLETSRLEAFPELGRKIVTKFHLRYLVVDGNVITYEIVLDEIPRIIIRAIRPGKVITT